LIEARVPLQHALYRRKDAPPRPAEDVPVADARERDVVLSTPEGDLAATLTIPKGAGPFPAAVFLAGSGPQDRDERIGPNTPLRDLARALADRGIASYRFDKATTSASVMAKRPVTVRAEYDDDAARAIDALRAAPAVDASRVFVVGHSLGATVAPRIAREAGPKVAGAILLAASGRPIDALVVEQVRHQAKLAGQDADAVVAPVAAKLKEIRDGGGNEPFLGAPASYWRDAMALDVSADLKTLGKPALVLQGDNDVQIHVERDFGLIRKTVGEDGGRVSYRAFAGLNHLFMKYDGTSTGAEYGAKGTVAPEVAEAIASWIAGLPSPAKDAPKPPVAK
jgi:dienelactone hydrolase